jgi:hypothetical protein
MYWNAHGVQVVPPGLSLALIGNASGQTVGVERGLEPRRFR